MADGSCDVLIVGAGPAGLIAAVVLAEQGVDFRIVDRASGPVEQSRAVIVHVRTLELLDRLGLAKRTVALGVLTTRVEIDARGKRAGGFALAGPGSNEHAPFPYALGLEQDRLEGLLVERLIELGVRVEWNTELVALTDGQRALRAVVRATDEASHTITARWVIGADGSRSAVRRSLGIGFAGRTYDQTGLLADVELEQPGPPAGTVRLNLTRGGFVGMFPLSSGRHRLFGAVPPHLAPPQHGAEVSHEAYAEVALVDIQRWFDDYFDVPARIHSAAWTALFRIHSRIAERFRSGEVFLVGDAAHIHSPAGGQGMNLAIGDAFNLAWKIALAAAGRARPRLLDSYEAERQPVARTVLRWTDRGFALETTRDPVGAWIRTHVVARLIGPLTRLAVVRTAVYRLFSQTWISYRHSPAVGGTRAGCNGPHPGDRASALDAGGLSHHLWLPDGARHRVAVERLLSRYSLDVTIELAQHRQPQLALIRPDGHIGYLGSPEDVDGLATYLDRLYT